MRESPISRRQLRRGVQRREAIRQAAIVRRGQGPGGGGWDRSAEEKWEAFGGDHSDANRACIDSTTEIIEAYERVMGEPA